jgi:hypothetical protein
MTKHKPSKKPAKKVNPYTAGASGVGYFDWFEAGRLRAGTVLWTEDVSRHQVMLVSFHPAVAS